MTHDQVARQQRKLQQHHQNMRLITATALYKADPNPMLPDFITDSSEWPFDCLEEDQQESYMKQADATLALLRPTLATVWDSGYTSGLIDQAEWDPYLGYHPDFLVQANPYVD